MYDMSIAADLDLKRQWHVHVHVWLDFIVLKVSSHGNRIQGSCRTWRVVFEYAKIAALLAKTARRPLKT